MKKRKHKTTSRKSPVKRKPVKRTVRRPLKKLTSSTQRKALIRKLKKQNAILKRRPKRKVQPRVKKIKRRKR